MARSARGQALARATEARPSGFRFAAGALGTLANDPGNLPPCAVLPCPALLGTSPRSAARTSDATQEEAAAALSAATDLTPTAVAALAAAVGGHSKGPGPKALDRGAPAACSLQDASWRLSLAVASSTTGETALPLVHVRLVTTQQGGEQAQAVLEMTLPELRALREEVDAAIAAVDRS